MSRAVASPGATARWWLVLVVFVFAGAMAPGTARAQAPLTTGFADDNFQLPAADARAPWFDRAVDANTEIVRLNIHWDDVARSQPAAPENPRDPAYDFSIPDGAVSDAAARGMSVLMTVYDAPRWAEGPNRPKKVAPGSWKPDVDQLEDFVAALSARYTGAFDPDGVVAPRPVLPEVRYLQAWNEPNLVEYLNPQWSGKKRPNGPDLYRGILRAFDDGAARGNPNAQIVTAGTAPYGNPDGKGRMRPLVFWRELLCLREKGLKPKNCPEPARFDIAAHHPITTSGGPRRGARHPDDAAMPEFKQVVRIVRAAERHGTIEGGNHPVWATEFWWESEPPDGFFGVPLNTQARYIAEAYYRLWRQGAEAAILFQLADAKFHRKRPLETFQSGVYFIDGRPKPSLDAARFPFVVDRKKGGQGTAWGKAPAAGSVVVEIREGGGWAPVATIDGLADGDVFTAGVKASKGDVLRARTGDQASRAWKVS